MADKTIGDLTQAESIGSEDLFVLQQNGEAKKLKGSQLTDYVTMNVISVTVETLPAGSQATATYNETTGALSLGIPQGEQGNIGPANTLTIGSVTSGEVASATITGEAPNQTLNFVLEKGDKGDTGSNFTILGFFDTLAALEAAVPNPKAGDAYGVGTAAPYDIYIWDAVHSKWVNNGNLKGNASLVISEIPKGRMRGDVDGDGKITENDSALIQNHISSTKVLTGVDLWCADTNTNGNVGGSDALSISQYLKGTNNSLTTIPTFADYYNNWTYHKVNDTSGYWTTELSISAITAETDGSITWGGTGFTGTFIKAEPFAGGVRIYANYPPIEALPCAVSYHAGTGGRFVIANTGVSETYVQDAISSAGARYVVVKLTASGWSEGKEQIVSVPGLKSSAEEQLIIPTQSATNIDKYYNAGIRISARSTDELTFSCETIPTENITVYLIIIPIFGKFE